MALIALALLGVVLFATNASVLAPQPTGEVALLAHRGVHQDFVRDGVTNETCTAARMVVPTHAYLENTLPSIGAAFAAGAERVEIDVQPTADGDFVVFHDWTLDCRTDGGGVTRDHTMEELRALDVGYGYTADGGRSFPFRGQGVGLMPSLREVLRAFPHAKLLVNFKSNDAAEGALLFSYLSATPGVDWDRLVFFGERPAERLRVLNPAARIIGRQRMKACATGYMLTGWLDHVSEACRNTVLFVPVNVAWLAWGWPNRFLARMRAANTEVVLIAPLQGGVRAGGGFDDAASLLALPRDWRGGVATDRIDIVGPLLGKLTPT